VKFFVSGKVGADEKVREIIKRLKEAGHVITFDWTGIPHLRPYDENALEARRAAELEAHGVREADVVVIVPHRNGVGLYVELGIAIGSGIPVRVISEGESRTMFFHHPLVRRVDNIEEVIAEFR
jgi:hypothetical protein